MTCGLVLLFSHSELTISWTRRWVFLLLGVDGCEHVFSSEETEVSAGFVTCPGCLAPAHQGKSKPRLLAPQIISFHFSPWPCFDTFDWSRFKKQNVVTHAKCTPSAPRERTGLSVSGQAVSVTRDPVLLPLAKPTSHPGRRKGSQRSS